MYKIKRALPIIGLIALFLGARYIGFENKEDTEIVILSATPVILIWTALKYSNPGRQKKYRLIAFLGFSIWLYMVVISKCLEKMYFEFYFKYSDLIFYILIVSFVISVIVGTISLLKIKNEE